MRTPLLCLGAIAPLLWTGLRPQDPVPAPEAPASEESHEDSPLEEHMHAVEDCIRKLRRSLRKPEQKADSLATLTELQVAAAHAKQEVPRMMASLPEDQRAAFQVAYRAEMLKLCRQILDVEEAVLADDADAVKAAFDSLRRLEDPAHERFIEGD